MSVAFALGLQALVLVGAGRLARRWQSGHIDFLTPMAALYAVHSLTRAIAISYAPDWINLNPIVQDADSAAIAAALFLTTAAFAVFAAAYVIVTRLYPQIDTAITPPGPASAQPAVLLLMVGVVCRMLLRLSAEERLQIPDSLATPLDTLAWAALAAVFLMAWRCATSDDGGQRQRAALLTLASIAVILFVDNRISRSREATLQPVVTAVAGYFIARRTPLWRIAALACIVCAPLFVWIGAMKTYRDYELGPGTGYVDAVPAVREYFGRTLPELVAGTLQDRFHALDSLIVVRATVPDLRPFEEGSVWSKAVLSAFVPRLFYPAKQVGWGRQFAVDFWGLAPEAEGQAAVGISHLGTFYVYGGAWGCIRGMAVLGAALAWLAVMLRRQRDISGTLMFVLVALTMCQVDRDLEVVLGGVLKLLVIYAALLFLRGLMTTSPNQALIPGIDPDTVTHFR